MMAKRLGTFLLTALMLVGLLPITALAGDYENHWAASYIQTANERGWIAGDGGGNFRPDASITRWEFSVMLWRMLGNPVPHEDCPFTDIPEGAFYSEAVTALYEMEVVSGYGGGIFGPDGTLTREMAFVMLARAFELAPQSTDEAAEYMMFVDYADIAAWTADAVSILTLKGYAKGNGSRLMPKNVLTRGEMAKLLVIVCDGENSPDGQGKIPIDDAAPVITLSQNTTASTYSSVKISVSAESEKPISFIGWRSSYGGASYTDKTGFTGITGVKEFSVSSNGWYAVCAVDSEENFAFKLIQITNIRTNSGGGGSSIVAVTGVTVSPGAATITEGTTRQLTAAITPANATNRQYSWSSDNTGVATVNASGLVTAVASGTAHITATTASGSFADSCVVTVNALVNAELPTISTQPADASVFEDAPASLSVTAGVTDGGTLSYQWYSNSTSSTTGGTLLSAATGSSFSPPTAEYGTTYYYCEVTNTNATVTGVDTATVVSDTARVYVKSTSITSFAGQSGMQWFGDGSSTSSPRVAYVPGVSGSFTIDNLSIVPQDGSATVYISTATYNSSISDYDFTLTYTDGSVAYFRIYLAPVIPHISFDGEHASKLQQIGQDMCYSLDGGETWKNITPDSADMHQLTVGEVDSISGTFASPGAGTIHVKLQQDTVGSGTVALALTQQAASPALIRQGAPLDLIYFQPTEASLNQIEYRIMSDGVYGPWVAIDSSVHIENGDELKPEYWEGKQRLQARIKGAGNTLPGKIYETSI